MQLSSSVVSLADIRAVLESDLLSLAASAAGFGLLSHVSLFRTNFPVEDYLFILLALYVVAVLSTAYAYLTLTQFSVAQALLRVILISSAFNTGLISSIGIYRLFFHRLHHFPGPVGAKISRFYNAYLAGKDLQYNVEIARLHQEYGDFIRTGPREVCIVRKSAIPLLFGPQSKCSKSTWYAHVSTNPKYCSIHHTRDHDDHRKRRKAWDRGFSIKSLGIYEPRVKSKVDLLASHVAKNLGKPIDVTAWTMFLSFDIMGDVGFGKDFHNLTTGVEHPAIKGVHDHMAAGATLLQVPWFLYILCRIPGAVSGYSSFFKWCADEIERKQKTWDANAYPEDVVSWLLKAYVEQNASAAPSRLALNEDSRAVIIAGSETTATTLATVLYYLAKHPSVLAKLQEKLDEAMPDGADHWSYDTVKDIAFIDDIINETLRLRPAVMTGGYRVTPAEGLQVDEVHIPGDTIVFVPVQLIQTDERYYESAKEFIPERWSEKRYEMKTDGAPFIPFLTGPYICPGKNLAMISLRTSISTIAQQYNFSFAPGETGEAFETGAQDTFTTSLPPLQLAFQRRQM
ncbi:tryprostatin B 6-hydroxylase [Aspergillus awamori]|uniref:Monooxygenase n=2 Tax=Aspergillus TaxID=5052 RepID=A0A3F3Q8J5_9EURO|nr:monooxygenase [Aspergillus welwitschiae]GCB28196.1 tryprostatin B 6-hydroxylase [Aspergillus awamori]GKZ57546.1 hypothetical protein AnigIFM49718_002868 [Aspergillus niger]RDH35498.1 monooxygenase [Aspergillus welwitschiae]GKZ73479.1 hypothetical protein AnigIFM50267_010409 [Aspergillus niger]GLA39859.1 hypothetical protein AnigIFM63309_007460 [Aspergillus niger]